MNAFGSGKRPDHEAVKLYKKWKLTYKFAPDVILKVAETIKRGGLAALDTKLTTYFELGLMTYDKIDGYETERHDLYKLAKSVNKTLGVYYENVDPEISSYIKPYLDMGFESGAIIAAADYCMKNGLKTLPDLDTVVRKFFAKSALTEKQVKAEISAENKYDGAIEKVLAAVGIMGRRVLFRSRRTALTIRSGRAIGICRRMSSNTPRRSAPAKRSPTSTRSFRLGTTGALLQ